VTKFGLLAAQCERLSREEGIITTACVDKVAASGGYMIASQASTLYAAPFAMMGGIGVLRENINFNRVLEKYGIDALTLTAGEAKAPLTQLSKMDKKGMRIAQAQLDKLHESFRSLVVRGRPQLKDTINDIADGNVYFGEEAEKLNIVDDVLTSGEYILERIEAGDRVLKLHRSPLHVQRRRINPLDFLHMIKKGGVALLSTVDWEASVPVALQVSGVLGILQRIQSKRDGDDGYL